MDEHKAARLEIFAGWKEIAHYLGKGVRTVQRYERELRLPVRRPAGNPKGSVLATKAELDAWISASPIRDAFRLTQSSVDHHARLKEFHSRIHELHQLRETAIRLREELTLSLATLQANIAALSAQSIPPSSPEHRLLSNVLAFKPKKNKAS